MFAIVSKRGTGMRPRKTDKNFAPTVAPGTIVVSDVHVATRAASFCGVHLNRYPLSR